MAEGKFDIYVFADWDGLEGPTLIGTLSAHFATGKKAFGFEYDKDWLRTDAQPLLDPDIDQILNSIPPPSFLPTKRILEYSWTACRTLGARP